MRRTSLFVLGTAAALALSACDSRDYEAELADLQTQLQDAQTELQQAQTENEELSGQITSLEGNQGQVPDTVQTELSEVRVAAQRTYDRLGALEREPDAPADRMSEALAVLRADIEEIVQSIEAAGQELGVEFEQAASEAGQAVEEGAGQAGEAAEGAAQEGEGAEETGEEMQPQPQQ